MTATLSDFARRQIAWWLNEAEQFRVAPWADPELEARCRLEASKWAYGGQITLSLLADEMESAA